MEPRDGLVIRHAVPAGIDLLTTARAGDGRWFVLSRGGRTVRCLPAGAADIDDAPSFAWDSSSNAPVTLSLASLPDGIDVVVARGRGGRLFRWELASGQPFAADIRDPSLSEDLSALPLAIAGTPGGPVAVTSVAGGGLRRWDAATGQPVGGVLGREHGTVLALAAGTLPGAGPVVVSSGGDGLLRRWDPAADAQVGERIGGCGPAMRIAIASLPGGPAICTLGFDGRVHRHDLLTGEPLGEPAETGWQPGHVSRVCLGLRAAVSADGGGVVAACVDHRSVRLWDLASGVPAGELAAPVGPRVSGVAAAYLHDATPLIVTGDADGQLRQFDARTGGPVCGAAEPHGTAAGAVLPVPVAGRVILAAQGPATVRLLDGRTGEPASGTWRMDCHDIAATARPGGGIMLAAAGSGAQRGDLVRYDWPSGASRRLPVPQAGIWSVAAAALPDGRVIIACGGRDGNVYRWDAVAGEPVGEPSHGHRKGVMAVAVARQADGTPMFVTGCGAGMVLRWDPASGEQIGPPLPGTHGGVLDLTVADLPDGHQVLAAVDGQALYRWDPVTGMSPAPVPVPKAGGFVAIHVGRDGIPVTFVHFPADYDEPEEGLRVECWRLDKLTRVEFDLPVTLRAVYDDAGATRMVLSELDGSLVTQPLQLPPLPPVPEQPVQEGLW